MPHCTEPTISVIVPVHNGGENFRLCLQSLTRAVPQPAEIIVVADGDTDGSWHSAQECGVQVLRLPTPGGPARARNVGARAARGDILFFVDADVTLSPTAMSQVAAAFKSASEVTAVFGSYDDEPAAMNFLSQYKNLLHHHVHQTAREEASTFWGACGAIRRTVFLAMGGFNEEYRWPSIEDIELGYRLTQAGHQVRLCKALQVKHLKRWGIVSLLRADFFYRALPWTELILQDRRFINDLNLRLSGRFSVLLVYGLLLAVIAAGWRPRALIFAVAVTLILLALNAPLYRFFWRKRGLWFAIRTIPWHWLYYLYSGVAFALGLVRFWSGRRRLLQPGFSVVAGKQPDSKRRAK